MGAQSVILDGYFNLCDFHKYYFVAFKLVSDMKLVWCWFRLYRKNYFLAP